MRPWYLFFMLGPITMAQTDSLYQSPEKDLHFKNFNFAIDRELLLEKKIESLKIREAQEFQTAKPLSERLDQVEKLMIGRDDSEADGSTIAYKGKTYKRFKGQALYDSRMELYELDPRNEWHRQILAACESVAVVVEKEKISNINSTVYYMDTKATLGKTFGLCPDQPFRDQPVLGVGTAFIASSETLLTAAHVFQRPLKDYVVVFGYRLLYANGIYENFFDAKDVYFPKAIKRKDDSRDVVEFTVDRQLDKPVLKISEKPSVKPNSEIFMLGYPCGLPIKISVNAHVADQSDAHCFYTTLDSFMGNSGSPVFDAQTFEVIGVLVSGEVDFTSNGNCNYSPSCRIPHCRGEKVIRIETIFN